MEKCLEEIKQKLDEEDTKPDVTENRTEEVRRIDDNLARNLPPKFSPFQKLGTGLSCCISHVVVHEESSSSWTFHLSGDRLIISSLTR